MTADEVYLWLLPVMAFGAFLLGGYLMVSGRQAKAAGEESHKVKFLGVEIESSTSGTTLIMLAIVVVVVVISLGIGRATDDDNGADDPTDPTTTPTTPTDSTSPNHNTDPPETSGLTLDNVLTDTHLEALTTGIGITAWTEVDHEDRPTLDCLAQPMRELDGFVKPPVFRNFIAPDSMGAAPRAMTTVAEFSSDDAAAAVFSRVRGWLESCPGNPGEGSRPVSVDQAGLRQDFVDTLGPVSWRNFWLSESSCTCIWVDSQGVGRNGKLIVLVSLDWRQMTTPGDAEGPMASVMRRAMDLADD